MQQMNELDDSTLRSLVDQLYRSLLNRPAEPQGLEWFVSRIREGRSLADMVGGMVRSAEFRRKYLASAIEGEPATEYHYFVHIPKTAGLSVKAYLQSVRPEEHYPGVAVEDLLRPRVDLRRFSFFAGHFLGFLDPILGVPTRKVTLLRDPLARTISHYLLLKREPTLPVHKEIAARPLRDVVSDPALTGFIENYQSRYLAGIADDRLLFTHCIEARRVQYESDALYSTAKDVLERMEVVGISENHGQFLRRMAAKWNLPMPGNSFQENRATNRLAEELDEATKKRIYALTEIDYAFYTEAIKQE